ncbi:Extradiol ring-cleavage dioxygenase, class III enzyme, subunit B [Mycena alexandri]|uniref:Extradiol ring-cleavage dioxygenase, class III enzyme, subunit B n=1 Tax=Mycena alexandri TaxID=1745969 RepID=A0AAD6WS72_9AGAR|nr:Extradiol ring-cleavage dioxygenase, class III enzyme, subunit B [Mycena alexandri]
MEVTCIGGQPGRIEAGHVAPHKSARETATERTATNPTVTVTRQKIGNATGLPLPVTVASLQLGTVLTKYPTNIPLSSDRRSSTSNNYGRFSEAVTKWAGAEGPLAAFLKDFGPALLKKYQPKGIVVFSAHWETNNERLVTDYGKENPLLMDYYGFQPELYQLKFKSKGASALSRCVVELYKEAGQSARLSPKTENRGSDGRGFQGDSWDGCLPPSILSLMFFRHSSAQAWTMVSLFPSDFEIPIVEVSIDSSLSPEINWTLGRAVAKLREEGILVLSGGLTVHNLRDLGSFAPSSAQPAHKAFDRAVLAAVGIPDETERKTATVLYVEMG